MGELINQSSHYLHYIEDEGTTPSENTTKVKADHPACTNSDTTLTCDFENTSQVSKAEIKQRKIIYNCTLELVPTQFIIRCYLCMRSIMVITYFPNTTQSHYLLSASSSPLVVFSFCDHADNVFSVLCLSLLAVMIVNDTLCIYM